MSRRSILQVLMICAVLFLAICAPRPSPPTPINVQLKWIQQAQYAGFYVAAEKGFYRDENIAITLTPGGVSVDIMHEVTSGRAQFGLIGGEKIILARAEGNKIKAISTIFRSNPFVVVTLPESGINKPADLIGREINIGGNDGLVQFTAMIARLDLEIADIQITPYTYDLEPFFSGQLDATPAIAAGSLIGILKTRPDANLIWAEDYGIHFYSDTLFTTDKWIAQNPEAITRFLRATLKGEQYAIKNPVEAVGISLRYAKDPDPEVQKEMMLASIPLIHTGEDQIGWMQASVWEEMQSILIQQNLLASKMDPAAFYTIQFLEAVYK